MDFVPKSSSSHQQQPLDLDSIRSRIGERPPAVPPKQTIRNSDTGERMLLTLLFLRLLLLSSLSLKHLTPLFIHRSS